MSDWAANFDRATREVREAILDLGRTTRREAAKDCRTVWSWLTGWVGR